MDAGHRGVRVADAEGAKDDSMEAWRAVEYRISIASVAKILQATEGVVFEGLRSGVVAKKQCNIKRWSYV